MSRRSRKRLRRVGCVVAGVLASLWVIALVRPFDVAIGDEHRGLILTGDVLSVGARYQHGWPDKAWVARSHLRAPGERSYFGFDGRPFFSLGWRTHRWNGNTPIIVNGPELAVPWMFVIALAGAPSIEARLRPRRRLRGRRRRAMRRIRMTLCHGCGYDLRASPIRCPECGLPTPPELAAADAAKMPGVGP
jgi:hypothetical protein